MEKKKETSSKKNPQVVFSWKAPLRAYKKRGEHVLRFYLALALLLSLIVFFFGDKILLVPIWALLFLFYVYTITPPPEVENKITKFGVETADTTIRFETLSHFYFHRRFGYDVLTIVTHAPFNFHTYLIIPNQEVKDRVMAILSEHLVYQEKPHRGLAEKLVDWLTNLTPED